MKISKGDVIIFPTDTVYGMGAKIDDYEALERIYEIKQRPKDKRLAVLCASVEDIEKIAYLNDNAYKLINEYMPGGLTIVVRTKEEYRNDYIYDTVAVRIPNHELSLRILKENGPLATSSVNISGSEPLNDYIDIVKKFSDEVTYIFPNAVLSSRVSSTIVDLSKNGCELIREGSIRFSEILKKLNN